MLYFRMNILLFLWVFFSIVNVYRIFIPFSANHSHSHFSQGPHMTLNILCLLVVGNHHVRVGFLIFDFLRYWGMNSGSTPWATPPALFCDGFYWDRVSELFCSRYLRTLIILISASCVANITCVSHCGAATEGFKLIWRRCSLCCT
jgi:hypothetical protein